MPLATADGVHVEAALAAAYAVLLLLVALGIERMARRSHRRADAYPTTGFIYHRHLDAWECPTGQHLARTEVDEPRRLVRYRARAAACNRCPLKSGCTDSAHGREVTRSLDPWLATEIGRFHHGLSLVLVGLAGLIATLALIRNHGDGDALILGPTLVAVAIFTWRRLPLPRSRPREGLSGATLQPPAATRSVRR